MKLYLFIRIIIINVCTKVTTKLNNKKLYLYLYLYLYTHTSSTAMMMLMLMTMMASTSGVWANSSKKLYEYRIWLWKNACRLVFFSHGQKKNNLKTALIFAVVFFRYIHTYCIYIHTYNHTYIFSRMYLYLEDKHTS